MRDSPRSLVPVILFQLVLTLLIGAIGGFAFLRYYDQIERDTHRTLAVIAEQKRQQIQHLLEQQRLDAELEFGPDAPATQMFGQWLAGEGDGALVLDRLRARLSEVERARGWGGLVLFDAGGRPVLTLGEADALGLEEQIQEVLRQPRTLLVDLHLQEAGVASYGVLTPIGGGKAPLGLAYLSWRADRALYPLVESWPVPTLTAETYLVRPDPKGVRFMTPLRHQQDAALTMTRPLTARQMPAARAALGESGILQGGRDYRDIPVLAYAAPVQGTPWLMLAEMDEREAYADIRTTAMATVVFMGLGLLLVYTAGYMLWRRERQRRELAALRAQRAAESRFRVIFEQAPLGVALRDSHSGRILEANPGFAAIVGRAPADLVGLDPLTITHPEDVRESRDYMLRLRRGEVSAYRQNKRYLRPDGSVVWASLICAPVQVETEETPRHLAIIEDITIRKALERELQEAHAAAEAANLAKSEFLAHMSHEIRTPMSAVLGLAQVLEREPLTADQRDLVERIRAAGQTLLAILNDVLDLSKIEAGQLCIQHRPFELEALLANLDSLMGPAARSKGLELRLETPVASPGPLLGDRLRLEQVLLNLTSNAIKFTAQGEVVIRVRVRETGPAALRLRGEVQDSGIGIAPEALAGLFTPFTQADASIGERFGGTGLGLSICKRLVELMGGVIGAESELGHGSTFWFELPLLRAEAEEPAAEPEDLAREASSPALPAAGPRLTRAHVLVVDDSAMNRDLVERALRLEGATATLAGDGQQAIQLLKARPQDFDAVLMDVQMPVMDGLTATRLIRADLGLSEMPVLAFSAGVFEDQQAAARAAGANEVLPKPMDLDQLAATLARWVKPRPARLSVAPAPSPRSPGVPALPMLPAAPRAPTSPPASSATAPARDAFPDIPGIDRALAERRLGRDRELFLGLLEQFVADNARVVDQTRQELERGDREAAIRRIHTLGSNAGFLCAQVVMESARELERALIWGEPGAEGRLAALGAQVATLIAASAPWVRRE
ncbi:MAG: ATP-binding protein [Chromatiaceae bacterium]|nr:ATP-binding protein [Candidatus Thioaporhodococcus sediminis]